MKGAFLTGCVVAGLAAVLSASPLSSSLASTQEVLALGPISAMDFKEGWKRVPSFGGVKYICHASGASGTRDCSIGLFVGPNFSEGSPRDCYRGAVVLVSGGGLHIPKDECASVQQ